MNDEYKKTIIRLLLSRENLSFQTLESNYRVEASLFPNGFPNANGKDFASGLVMSIAQNKARDIHEALRIAIDKYFFKEDMGSFAGKPKTQDVLPYHALMFYWLLSNKLKLRKIEEQIEKYFNAYINKNSDFEESEYLTSQGKKEIRDKIEISKHYKDLAYKKPYMFEGDHILIEILADRKLGKLIVEVLQEIRGTSN